MAESAGAPHRKELCISAVRSYQCSPAQEQSKKSRFPPPPLTGRKSRQSHQLLRALIFAVTHTSTLAHLYLQINPVNCLKDWNSSGRWPVPLESLSRRGTHPSELLRVLSQVFLFKIPCQAFTGIPLWRNPSLAESNTHLKDVRYRFWEPMEIIPSLAHSSLPGTPCPLQHSSGWSKKLQKAQLGTCTYYLWYLPPNLSPPLQLHLGHLPPHTHHWISPFSISSILVTLSRWLILFAVLPPSTVTGHQHPLPPLFKGVSGQTPSHPSCK